MPREENVPIIVGELAVVLYSQIDERHRPSPGCRHIVYKNGEMGPAWGVAICEVVDGQNYVLFRCEDDWYPASDTTHASLEEAKNRAEREYEGLAATWEVPPS